MLRDFVSDLRHGVRSHLASPGFTLVALVVLAVGIGANTAIFSVVNQVLLRSLPYPEGDRLVMLWSMDTREADGRMPVTPGDFRDWRAQARSYASLSASSDGAFNLTGDGEPEMLIGYKFEPNMFELLGVSPALGRSFVPGDGEKVVVLSHALWSRRYDSNPAILGRAVQLNGESHTVIGVMPKGFEHPRRSVLWVPLLIAPSDAGRFDQRYLRIVGRLAPGATLDTARAELATIHARVAAEHPDSHRNQSADVVSMRDMQTADIRTPLLVLAGAVGFLLMLACANVAGLLIARAAARQRELAVRVALGATRARLVRQMVTETLLLTMAGAALGLLLAWWTTGSLVAMFPQRLGNVAIPDVKEVPLDGVVVAFSTLLAAITAALCGLPAAISATAGDVEQTLREGTTGETRRAARLRRVLVTGELALATVIAVGAGLLLRTSWHLGGTDLGFRGDGVLTARMFVSDKRYPEPEQQRQLVADMLERLRARPEIESAGAFSTLPLSGWNANAGVLLDGARDEDSVQASYVVADAGAFQALGIPLLSGRLFSAADRADTPPVALVDERFVRSYLGGADPVGKRLNLGSAKEPELHTVIGVVGPVKVDGPAVEAPPTVYVSYSQRPWPLVALIAKAKSGDAMSLAGVVRAAVWEVDDDMPLSYVMSVDELRADILATSRVISMLFGFFAATALLLGALGVYGLMAHAVARRTHEIGVRMALGARQIDVVGWVFRQSATLLVIGLAIGVAASLALARVLASQLHGVSTADVTTIAAVSLVLALSAALASWLPARRAARVNPSVALRAE